MSATRPSEKVLPKALRELIEARLDSEDLVLPFLPGTASQVMSGCSDESWDARGLAELISRDQALASHVLRVANSAAYAPKEPITSLQQATSRLGMAAVCEIAVAVSLRGRIFRVPGQQVKIRQMWMHSAAAGLYAKDVARMLSADVEGAFLCGLLHDTGRPLVMQILLDIAKERTERPVPAVVLDAAMDEYHERVGREMARRWNLAGWIVEAIGHHHDYAGAGEHRTAAMITCLSDVLTHWALADERSESDFPAEHRVISDLGLHADDVTRLLALRGRVLELIEAFL